MKGIREAGDLSGKRVLVRVDWSDHDSFRIDATLPTLKYLSESGAKLVVATHDDKGSIDELRQFLPQDAELLPNLRESAGEEANSEEFAKELAEKADIYVNEAFSVSHREHASIVGVPRLLPSYAGLRFVEEVEELSKAFHPPHPFLLVLGGAKFETKMPLVEKFLNIADDVFIGGTMAKSVTLKDPKISLPSGDLTALDTNEETIKNLKLKIENSKFIIWNGPLGQYETGHTKYTYELAKLIAESSAYTIVGGGDTLLAIESLNLLSKFSFVSTGGGAMLDFLAKGTLPGIKALS